MSASRPPRREYHTARRSSRPAPADAARRYLQWAWSWLATHTRGFRSARGLALAALLASAWTLWRDAPVRDSRQRDGRNTLTSKPLAAAVARTVGDDRRVQPRRPAEHGRHPRLDARRRPPQDTRCTCAFSCSTWKRRPTPGSTSSTAADSGFVAVGTAKTARQGGTQLPAHAGPGQARIHAARPRDLPVARRHKHPARSHAHDLGRRQSVAGADPAGLQRGDVRRSPRQDRLALRCARADSRRGSFVMIAIDAHLVSLSISARSSTVQT